MTVSPADLTAAIEPLLTEEFSGVVSVGIGDTVVMERAHGLADRAHQIPATIDTKFAIASGSKGFTALVVASLIVDGSLAHATTARELLGEDLPLIADDVTIEHLLTHTSGIGDYLDEDGDIDDYILGEPVHRLDNVEAFLPVLDGFPTSYPAGDHFSYCNGGYLVLALLAQRASGRTFHELVRERVLTPASMTDTDYLRSDALPGDAAIGYLADGRTNVLHLPVTGNGDGGAYSTVADFRRFWRALFAGDLLPVDVVADLVRPRSSDDESRRYGAGFWLREAGSVIYLEGYDAGVAFRSVHDPDSELTHTVMGNTSDDAWPISRRLMEITGC